MNENVDTILQGFDLSDASKIEVDALKRAVKEYLSGAIDKSYFKKQSIRYNRSIQPYRSKLKSMGHVSENSPFANKGKIEIKKIAEQRIKDGEVMESVYYSLYKTLPKIKK